MERKKANSADLDDRRTQGFLLGLVLVLALLFVGFEYTSAPSPLDGGRANMDDLARELEMAPPETHDMVSVSEPSPASKAVTANARESNATHEERPQRIASVTNPLVVGEGEGLQKDAHVAEAIPQTPASLDNDDQVYRLQTVEKPPLFPGGWVALMKWLTKNLHYPPYAQQQKIQGKVVVSFIVNKDGTVSDAKVEKSVDISLDREAMRVVRMMPRWEPAIVHDKPCRSMFVIPIVFAL